MRKTLKGFAHAAKLARKYDAGFEPDQDGGYSSIEPLSEREARGLVDELESAGFEASWAPDHDNRDVAWIYVKA